MPRSPIFGFGRVNLIKKVKVDGEWKFCPAVVEQGRKLNDLVRVRGQVETHSEGTYYLEWREKGQRWRQPVHNRALIFEQARLKGLELDGATCQMSIRAGGWPIWKSNVIQFPEETGSVRWPNPTLKQIFCRAS